MDAMKSVLRVRPELSLDFPATDITELKYLPEDDQYASDAFRAA